MMTTNDFLLGYLECAIWTGTDPDNEDQPLDQTYSPSDFSPEALALAAMHCELFEERNEADLASFRESYPQSPDGDSWRSFAGHNFWLNRNGHGAGFWDLDLVEGVGDRLSEASRSFGETDVYPGDDGLLHFSR